MTSSNTTTEHCSSAPLTEGDWSSPEFKYSLMQFSTLQSIEESMIRCLEAEGLSIDEISKSAGRHFTNSEVVPTDLDATDPSIQKMFTDDLNGWEDDN